VIAVALFLAAAGADPIPGSWEGTSLCQVKPSPCHDEHAIYRIKSARSRQYSIDGYRLASGRQLFMGRIDVTLDSGGTHLNGAVVGGGQLQLTLKGPHMSGRMTKADGTLVRLIELTKH
jgi:hypothetical protein